MKFKYSKKESLGGAALGGNQVDRVNRFYPTTCICSMPLHLPLQRPQKKQKDSSLSQISEKKAPELQLGGFLFGCLC